MRDLVDELMQSQVRARLFGEAAAPRLDRLVILEPLGQGAMGTVFAAYDPKLDRKVAVKVVAGDVLEEARALGRLQHPSVVTVHDAIADDGVVAIVMELAPGVPLRQWLPRPWSEVLAVMRQVAEGLAAAHAAGLVHCDVKPENVIVGDDRPRLVDFGLASQAGSSVRAGTPAYMAPEVLAGGPVSPLADQWSFAAVLHEAIHGVRPHAGTSRETLLAGARAAARDRPRPGDAPAWVEAVITRGLAAEPTARFPDMNALVAALAPRRRRVLLLGTAAVALAVGLAFNLAAHPAAPVDPCAAGGPLRARAWPAERAAALGRTAWDRKAADDLTALADAWAASHRRVCEATRVRHEQPEALLELRMRCLDRALARIAALGQAAGADDDDLAVAVAALPRPEACESASERPELRLPDDAAARARVTAGEQALDRAWAAYMLGHYRDAAAVELADTGHVPLDAELLALRGAIEARVGKPEAAREHLESALGRAAAARNAELELEVWTRLLRLELFAGEPARVVEWAPFARVASVRAGRQGAEVDGIVAEALRTEGKLAEARALLEQALASTDPLRGDQRALLLLNLGSIELTSGHATRALARFEAAEASAASVLGPEHPSLALYLDKRARALAARGRLREALALHDRSVSLRQAAFGEHDRALATALFHRGETRLEAGQSEQAIADLERARAIRAELGASARLGEIDLALGDAHLARGERAQAIALYQQAARLDPRLVVAPRLVLLDVDVPLPDAGEPSLDAVMTVRAQVHRLVRQGDREGALAAARALAGQCQDVDALLAIIASEALQEAGDADAAAAMRASARRALLGDEPGLLHDRLD